MSGIFASPSASLAFFVASSKMSRRSFVLIIANLPCTLARRPRRCVTALPSSIDASLRSRERCLDEDIDVTVEHAGRVADLDIGAVILHDRIWVEHVRADLTAPVGRAHLAAFLGLFLFLLTHTQLEQPRLQDAHRGLAVLKLRALVLARDHDPRR